MADLTHDDEAKTRLLRSAKRIAVVGASADPTRTSHRIFRYLHEAGYDALPVTPKTEPVCGVDPVADLAAAAAHWPEGIDVVDVFRRKDATPAVAQAAIEAGAKAIWFQLETDHDDAVAAALEAGLDVVRDQCIYVEHARLL